MKASKQCPKCDSLKVGYLERTLDKGEHVHVDAVVGITKPWGWLGGREPLGGFEAYVCTDCGYFEHYVKGPGEFDFTALQGFHWVNEPPPEGGAYR
jgi:predicted nucleic-acid-binding Zn-ribbon protein